MLLTFQVFRDDRYPLFYNDDNPRVNSEINNNRLICSSLKCFIHAFACSHKLNYYMHKDKEKWKHTSLLHTTKLCVAPVSRRFDEMAWRHDPWITEGFCIGYLGAMIWSVWYRLKLQLIKTISMILTQQKSSKVTNCNKCKIEINLF